MTSSFEDVEVEAGAKALYEQWANYPACSASKSWEDRCKELPGSAADFRKKARVTLAAGLAKRASSTESENARLREEVERLRKALEPFATTNFDGMEPAVFLAEVAPLINAARAALATQDQERDK